MTEQVSTSTELRYARTVWGEIDHRSTWLFFGTFIAIALFFIPIIGWLLGIALFGAMAAKIFGRRDKIVIGPCPVCSTEIYFPDDIAGGDCPACASRLVIRDGQFIYFK